MTDGTLSKPSEVAPAARKPGGDDEVERDSMGRPRILIPCDKCEATGRVESPKTGKPIKCSKCSGNGQVKRSFTRTTTYIDVLEDKSNLEAWQMRMVLVGVARDPKLLNEVDDLYTRHHDLEREQIRLASDQSDEAAVRRAEIKSSMKEIKDALNRKAQVAKKTAGAEDKADKGTELHTLSELVDTGKDLPREVSFEDVLDLDAYKRVSEGFKIIHMEQLVVCDELKVAGTPDRVSIIDREWVLATRPRGDLYGYDSDGKVYLIAPDGSHITEDELLITDLKTGTVEYGQLKMAMQLAIYAHSDLYDKESGAREPLAEINRKWGFIMNVPAGTGEGQLYWADLSMGWEAVQVAGAVRRLRGSGKNALKRFGV